LLGYLVTKFFGDQEIKNNKLLPINKCFYHTKNGGAIKKTPTYFLYTNRHPHFQPKPPSTISTFSTSLASKLSSLSLPHLYKVSHYHPYDNPIA
jgi:hypothetical protein